MAINNMIYRYPKGTKPRPSLTNTPPPVGRVTPTPPPPPIKTTLPYRPISPIVRPPVVTNPIVRPTPTPMPIKTGVSPTNPGQARFKNPNITGVSPGQKVGIRKKRINEFTRNPVGRQEGFKQLASQAIKQRANKNQPNKGLRRRAE